MSFDSDLLAGFATLLASSSIGLTWRADGTAYAAGEVGIYDSLVPATPDDVVTLTVYPLSDDAALADSVRGLQVRTRRAGASPVPSRDLDDAIADVLLGNYPQTLSTGIRVTTLVRSSGVPLGQDDNQRWERVSNYTVGLWRPSMHRL